MPDVLEEVLTDVEIVSYEELDDPNHLTHIVNPQNNLHIYVPGMTSKEIVQIARMNGLEVTCLCGHRFVPTHDPDKYDACQPCIQIAGEILRSF